MSCPEVRPAIKLTQLTSVSSDSYRKFTIGNPSESRPGANMLRFIMDFTKCFLELDRMGIASGGERDRNPVVTAMFTFRSGGASTSL
jgi:hypothetical protein